LHPIGAGGRDRRDDQTQAIRWYLYDGLGSVLGEVDTAGNLTASRKYDVYGLVRAGDSGTSRHKFVGSLGHTSEDETGLIYMRARWMDPALGRRISLRYSMVQREPVERRSRRRRRRYGRDNH